MSTYVKHPETGAVCEVPDSAVPIMAASGWQKLNKSETADLDKQHRADLEDREATLRAASGVDHPEDSTTKAAAGRRQANTSEEKA